MNYYRTLHGVGNGTLIRFAEKLDLVKQSGDPRYSFQTKEFLAEVGGFSAPVLNNILRDLDHYGFNSWAYRTVYDYGQYELIVPGMRQYLRVKKVDRPWEQDCFSENRARANMAYRVNPETGEYDDLENFPGDN